MAPKEEKDDDDVSSVDVDEEEHEVEEDEEAMNDLNNADIVTKYRCAGDIANAVLSALIELIKPGVRAVELCAQGDALVEEATAKVYNVKKDGKKVDKGSAFPTCVSVNNCCGHYSPLTSEDDVTLAEGDVVKIDLGVHVDGYIGVVAHTHLCSAGDAPATGRKADVMMAAWTATELAHRMFKEGAKNTEITDMIGKVAAAYKCTPLEGVLSHQMKKHVIDANKVIINKASAEHTVKEISVDKGDVFSIDIVMSTGEGKPKLTDKRTTVFKRDVQEKYSLKMKASRAFFSEVNARFPTLPFTLRAGDERAWRMGVVECVKHRLFIEYPVLYEKTEELVAQVKFTAAVLPSGNIARTTTSPPPNATSECKLEDEELATLLATEIASKKKKKNKKKGGGDKEDKE